MGLDQVIRLPFTLLLPLIPLVVLFASDAVRAQNTSDVDSTGASFEVANAGPADCCYLHNNPTPPTTTTVSQAVLPMSGELPTALVLYNYDADRDLLPGLRLETTSLGLGEVDPTKFQVWRSGPLASGLTISGTILLDVWGALQDYQTGVGAVEVFLRDYNPTSTSYVEITNGTLFARDWQEGVSDFIERMALVLGTTYTIPAGHELEVRLGVNPNPPKDVLGDSP